MTPAPLSEFAQKRARQAVAWDKDSDTTMKYFCTVAAYAGVGDHSGVTNYIAAECNRSIATVLNRSQAFRLYAELRNSRPANKANARFLWRALPASHWWLAFSIHNEGYNALYYLNVAYASKYSGRDMMAEFRADKDAGHAPMLKKRLVIGFVGTAQELSKDPSLTREQRAAVDGVIQQFSE